MFSVVIPLYNKRHTIRDTLRCLREQTVSPGEIIVVDDGSDDGSQEIVRNFDPGIRLISTPAPRSGPSAARNLGIQAATQEWVAFLDADDLWSSEYLASIKEIIAQGGPRVVGAFTAWKISYGEGSGERRNPFSRHRPKVGVIELRAFLDAWLSDSFCPIWTSACSFKRASLLKVGMFDEAVRRGEDKQLWLKMLAEGPAAYTVAALATYNMNVTGQLTSKPPTELHPVCRTVDQIRPGQPQEIQTLLDRLYNLQVWQYAVQVKLASRLPRSMLGHFRVALNPLRYAALLALTTIPTALQRTTGRIIFGRRAGASF
jgi:succinoglycan biosynthesis protein ExoO